VDALLMVGALPVPEMRFDPICEDRLIAVLSSRSPLAQQDSISVESLREIPIIASRMKDCRFHQPFLHALLAPLGITPRIVESPQSCTVQFAYAAAGEGLAIASQAMATCMFPGVVARPFREKLANLQLGLAAMTANESRSMTIFRRVVMECASVAFQKRLSADLKKPKAMDRPVVLFPGQTQAS
jgi:DNA-binding transcriptional LysR family regulator